MATTSEYIRNCIMLLMSSSWCTCHCFVLCDFGCWIVGFWLWFSHTTC